MQITEAMILEAVQTAVDRVIPDDRVDAMAAEAVRQRIGSVSIDWIAKDWSCDVKTVKRTLKKLGVPTMPITRKNVRVKISELEAALDSRAIRPAPRKTRIS